MNAPLAARQRGFNKKKPPFSNNTKSWKSYVFLCMEHSLLDAIGGFIRLELDGSLVWMHSCSRGNFRIFFEAFSSLFRAFLELNQFSKPFSSQCSLEITLLTVENNSMQFFFRRLSSSLRNDATKTQNSAQSKYHGNRSPEIPLIFLDNFSVAVKPVFQHNKYCVHRT